MNRGLRLDHNESGATALQLPLIEMCDVLPDGRTKKSPADFGGRQG
jgi:hypothetical protein